MSWVEVMESILWMLLQIGMVWLVVSTMKELFDKWLKRKALEQRLDRMAK